MYRCCVCLPAESRVRPPSYARQSKIGEQQMKLILRSILAVAISGSPLLAGQEPHEEKTEAGRKERKSETQTREQTEAGTGYRRPSQAQTGTKTKVAWPIRMGAKVISPKDTAPQGGSRLTTLVVDTDQLTSPGSILGMVAYVSTAGPIRTKSLYNAGCWPVYRLGLLQFYLRKVSL